MRLTLTAFRTLRETQQFWGGVDRARRVRVKRSVWKGERVADPRDAELAVKWARQVRAHHASFGPARRLLFHAGLLTALLAIGLATGLTARLVVGASLLAVASLGSLAFTLWLAGRRASRAEEANLAGHDLHV
jgi:hypothetical protein